MLQPKEIQLLINLVKAHISSFDMLRGFRDPTEEEQEEIDYYNNIINKLKEL